MSRQPEGGQVTEPEPCEEQAVIGKCRRIPALRVRICWNLKRKIKVEPCDTHPWKMYLTTSSRVLFCYGDCRVSSKEATQVVELECMANGISRRSSGKKVK